MKYLKVHVALPETVNAHSPLLSLYCERFRTTDNQSNRGYLAAYDVAPNFFF